MTKTLYRPGGPKELALIEASGWKEFPPRLPEQPIFYPVINEEYALGTFASGGFCLKSRNHAWNRVSTGSDSDLVSDQHATLPYDY